MMMMEGVVFGNYISSTGIRVDLVKIEVILQIPIPKTQKEVRSFLGHASYYQRFIEFFFKIATPLFTLLLKEAEFVWTYQCQSTFTYLKQKVSQAPILRGPDWSVPFHIFSDVSDIAIGVVLGQQEILRS